jgi:hypothetical protein
VNISFSYHHSIEKIFLSIWLNIAHYYIDLLVPLNAMQTKYFLYLQFIIQSGVFADQPTNLLSFCILERKLIGGAFLMDSQKYWEGNSRLTWLLAWGVRGLQFDCCINRRQCPLLDLLQIFTRILYCINRLPDLPLQAAQFCFRSPASSQYQLTDLFAGHYERD